MPAGNAELMIQIPSFLCELRSPPCDHNVPPQATSVALDNFYAY